ncbi:MAG: hypothetical protein HWN67_01425 [Candidatus Helarchaeota archaeon]|nr:hypothetical protein [Candidatus Helarchaeota archaeon]
MFKGVIRGTATSNLEGCSFVIKIDDIIEGLPEEFVVYSSSLRSAYDRQSGGSKRTLSTQIRQGDSLVIEGEIIQEFIGNENLELIRMGADHIYNITLKCGF